MNTVSYTNTYITRIKLFIALLLFIVDKYYIEHLASNVQSDMQGPSEFCNMTRYVTVCVDVCNYQFLYLIIMQLNIGYHFTQRVNN